MKNPYLVATVVCLLSFALTGCCESVAVPTPVPVTITFGVTLNLVPTTPYAIANTALIDDGLGNVWSRQAGTVVNGLKLYFPLLQRGP